MTWKPRSKAAPPVAGHRLHGELPRRDARRSARRLNRTVFASSARSKRTCADGGVAVQPCGTSRATSASAAPGALFVTATRISRVLAAAWRCSCAAAPPPSARSRISGCRPHRQRRHHLQLHALLAAEDVALVAVLHGQRQRAPARRRRSARARRRTAWAGTAARTAHPRRTCTGPPAGAVPVRFRHAGVRAVP